MKKLSLLFMVCLILTFLTACGDLLPQETQLHTEPPTESPTESPAESPAEPSTDSSVTGPQPMELVGLWQRTHTEVEGDQHPNTQATLSITGNTVSELAVTYNDWEFPDTDFSEQALTIQEGELYPECGNADWYIEIAPTGIYSYSLTLLDDGTLLLQCSFQFDGMPMVSYQWFARSE